MKSAGGGIWAGKVPLHSTGHTIENNRLQQKTKTIDPTRYPGRGQETSK